MTTPTTPVQMYAVLDETGQVVSYGSEVASDADLTKKKLSKLAIPAVPKVDEVWDPSSKKVVARTKTPTELEREADNAFLDGLKTKIKNKTPLTQDERDRMTLIQLTRSS